MKLDVLNAKARYLRSQLLTNPLGNNYLIYMYFCKSFGVIDEASVCLWQYQLRQYINTLFICLWTDTLYSYTCVLEVVDIFFWKQNGPLARYVKLRVAHAPGMPGTFSPPAWVNDPDMHHGTYVTHVPWCMPGSLTCSFLWSWCREKPSRHPRRMRNPQFYVSGKRPMAMNS